MRRRVLPIVVLLGALAACESGGGKGAPAVVICPPVDAGETDEGGSLPAPPERSKTDRLFDEAVAPRHIAIELSAYHWQWLQDHATDEQYVPADVTIEGETSVEAAIRYKGAYGSLYACFDEQGVRICPKLSLKVSFNEYDPDGRFWGVRKLILNSCNRDPTCLRERLAYAVFREAGVVAPRTVHVEVSVNGEPIGLYLLVEATDHELLEDHFADPGGNLFKESWPQYLEAQPYLERLRTNEDAADVQRNIDFATLLREVDDADFLDAVSDWIDPLLMLRYFVADQLTNNWDGIWKFYCQGEYCGNHNYYLYDDPATGRFVVIPWDLDHTFGSPNPDLARSWQDESPEACKIQQQGWIGTRAPQCDPLLRGLMLLQWEAYLRTFAELTAPGAPLSEEAVMSRLERYRRTILPLVEADPLGPTPLEWRRETARLRHIVMEQYRQVERLLDEEGAGR